MAPFRVRRGFRIAGLSLLGVAGLTGVVAALQHYLTNHIPRTGQEQHLIVRIDAPYGSISLRPGTSPNDIATIESDNQSDGHPSYHARYFIRNQTLGILQLGIGTDEGILEQPPIAMWRANSDFSLASATTQSDMGYPMPTSHAQQTSTQQYFPIQQQTAIMPPLRLAYSSRFRIVSTDASTRIASPAESASNTRIFLSTATPMDFRADLGFGDGESSLDLSGLPITSMVIETGATKATIFSQKPNPNVISTCRLSAGLGECSFTGISNLNANNFIFEGGVGSYHLGFEGRLAHNLDASVSLGFGMCSLSIPPTAGRVQIFYDDGPLSSYTFSGLTVRRSGYATSVGFNNSTSPVLTLRLSSVLGKISVSYH